MFLLPNRLPSQQTSDLCPREPCLHFAVNAKSVMANDRIWIKHYSVTKCRLLSAPPSTIFKVLQNCSQLMGMLSECQTAWIRMRRRGTRRLIRIQAVCSSSSSKVLYFSVSSKLQKHENIRKQLTINE